MEELVALNLRRAKDVPPPAPAGTADEADVKGVVQNLLRILTELPPEFASKESKDTAALRAKLQECRGTFTEATHAQEQRIAAAMCVKTCDQYLRRMRLDFSTREAELTEVVSLLREAASGFIGDSADFHTQLLNSADRFKTMARLDDIRDLKKQLTVEVSSLQRVVEDKQKRDQQVIAKLSEKVEVLQADLHKAEEEASLDPLTRIPNRGAFDRALAKMVQAARANSTPLTLAMIDIDHFKAVNDTHGHQVGDRVLLCTAEWLRGSLRHTDFVGRYGGEEFAVILVDADLGQAEDRFTQVLAHIATRDYAYQVDGEQRSVRFTVSCGVSQLAGHDSEQELVHRADQALYDAKRKGRNRVVTKKASLFGRFL